MPPRLQLFRSGKPATIFPRVSQQVKSPLCLRISPQRCISADEKPLPKANPGGSEPNQEQLPHISEEAAVMGKITGGGGPEIDQGTPVQEVGPVFKNIQHRASSYIFSRFLSVTKSPKIKHPKSCRNRSSRRHQREVDPTLRRAFTIRRL